MFLSLGMPLALDGQYDRLKYHRTSRQQVFLEEVQRASSHRQDSATVEEHLDVAEGAPFDVQVVVYTLNKNVLLAKYIYTMEPFKNSNASLPQMNQSNTDYSV